MKIRDYVTGRVIAWIVITILASIFGMSRAHAATFCGIKDTTTIMSEAGRFTTFPNSYEAQKACNAMVNEGVTTGGGGGFYAKGTRGTCVHNPSTKNFTVTWTDTASFSTGNCAATYPTPPTQRPYTGWLYTVLTVCTAGSTSSGSCNSSLGGQCTKACFDGCEVSFTHTRPDDDWNVTEGPQTGYWKQGTWTESGEQCSGDEVDPKEPPPECPAGQKKLTDGTCGVQGECPVGMHETPPLGACSPDGSCPTGQQKGPDGSCVAEGCPPGYAKKKNGTCGLDEDGDGEADEEDPGNEDGNKASGGESCEYPPVCSGDPILCLQTKIQWRIDCNTRKNQTISGGACTAPPVCTGEGCNPTEYAALMMQWRTACALEKGNNGTPGGGDGSQPEWTKANGMNQNPGAGQTGADTDLWAEGDTIDGSTLDQSGWIGAGSCPGMVSSGSSAVLTQGFFARLSSPPPEWCNYIAWVRVIFIMTSTIGWIIYLART